MDLERQVGLRGDGQVVVPDRRAMFRAIVLKLAAMGFQVPDEVGDAEVLDLGRDLFARYREQSRLLSEHLSPVDRRIQDFLDDLFMDLKGEKPIRLPSETFLLDRYGLARELSLPLDATTGTTSRCRATGSTTASCTTRSTIAARRRASFTSQT